MPLGSPTARRGAGQGLSRDTKTIATDVRVSIDPPFEGLHDLSVAALQRLERGIASLPPGRVLTWRLGKSVDLVAPTQPQPRTITVDAAGPFGPLPRLEYVIDMTDFRESNDRPVGTLHLLAKAVDRRPSGKDIAGLTAALDRLGEQQAPEPSAGE